MTTRAVKARRRMSKANRQLLIEWAKYSKGDYERLPDSDKFGIFMPLMAAGFLTERLPQYYGLTEKGEKAMLDQEICIKCAATSEEEAGPICRATQDVTGEYTCPGSDLWASF